MAITEERREVSDFDYVKLEGTGELTIEQGEQDSLVIEADADLLPKLKSDVRDGRLELGLRNWFDAIFMVNSPTIRYHITMRSMRGLSISGSGQAQTGPIRTDRMVLKVSGNGRITIADLQASDLDVSFSGTGKAQVSGAVQTGSIGFSGTGEFNAENLACQDVKVRISGSGKVRINAEKSLDVHISGSGDVGYRGQPHLQQHISGVGKIHQI